MTIKIKQIAGIKLTIPGPVFKKKIRGERRGLPHATTFMVKDFSAPPAGTRNKLKLLIYLVAGTGFEPATFGL